MELTDHDACYRE